MSKKATPKRIEDARILFRNFSGEEGQYNKKGDRNFAVALDENMAKEMEGEGWNVKRLRPREDEEVGTPYVQVAINYSNRPPSVYLITQKMGREIMVLMPEDQLDAMDWIDIEKADLSLNPYEWEVNGNSGTKAYLKSLYITQRVDPLMERYSHIPEVRPGATPLEIEAGNEDENILEGEIVND